MSLHRPNDDEDSEGAPRSAVRAILQIIVALAIGLALVWLASNDDQRCAALLALHLAADLGNCSAQGQVPRDPGLQFRLAEPAAPALTPLTELRGGHHPDGLGSPCRRAGPAHPSHKAKGQIYRWTGADGKPVFSDRPPPDGSGQVVGATRAQGVEGFSLDYDFEGGRRDGAFDQAIQANVAGVFRFLTRDLGLAGMEPVHVRLRILDGVGRFVRYRDAKTEKLGTTSGFYSFDGNEAVVRWMGTEPSLAVVRHEVAHLALGNWLGDPPIWFNEGLAEVVERLRFEQSYARVPVQDLREVARFQGSGVLPSLARFLDMDRDDWNRLGDDKAYGYAWSLLQFLLEDPQRLPWVTGYLNAQGQSRCARFDHKGYLERTYPGGIAGLEQAWGNWLAKGETALLTF